MRPRKQRNYAQKIDLSHTTAFRKEAELLILENKLKRRNLEQMIAKHQKMIEYEVHNMFRSLGTVPERLAPYATLAPTKTIKLTVKTTRTVPTEHEVVQNSMMKSFERGKNFVREKIFYKDSFPAIDWEAFRQSASKRPEEVFESLKECYII